MEIIFLSTALTDKTYHYIVNNCNSFKPTYSGVGFDKNVAEGLSKYAKVKVISLAPIPSYPKFKFLKWEKRFDYENKIIYDIPPMLNLPILKEIWYMCSTYMRIKKLLMQDNSDDKIILVGGLYRNYLIPATIIKKIYNIKIYAIVPDIPEIMISYRRDYNKTRQFFNKFEKKWGNRFRKNVDGFIFLTKHMNYINVFNLPYLVVDGMFKAPDIINKTKAKRCKGSKTNDKNTKTIMYAGKLSKEFGLDKLVEAFLLANIKDTTLLLYGDGDYVSDINKLALQHKNIIFGGVIPHEQVLEEEVRADLLVDPRPSDTLMSKMAFPSKIIEYMISGTPVLTTNLPCFSKDYEKYQYRFNIESVIGMANTLRHVMSINETKLNQFGERAKNFVLREKTVEIQCKKIYEFLKNCSAR